MAKDDTLCWDCKKALNKCSWSQRFEPVAGWDAKETLIDGSKSYYVIGCPLFEQDRLAPKTCQQTAKELGISLRTYYRRKRGLRNED